MDPALPSSRAPERVLPVAGAALAVLLALDLQVAGFHSLRFDDAFITYRYGANLASGHGLVFNPGERLMGSTSPLHSLGSALVYALVGKDRLPSAMSALGCAGWTAQAVAVFLLLRAALGSLPALLVALAVAAGAAGSYEWVAMETNWVAAFALWALTAAVAGRWVAAALLLAVAGLARPDAYLLALPLGLLALSDLSAGRVRGWRRPALAFALPTLSWLVFAALYFGTVVPQSAVAKVGRMKPAAYLGHLLAEPARTLLGGRDAPAWVALVWLLAAAGAALLVARRTRLWVLPAWGALHFAAYLVLRPFASHRWHAYPLVLVVAVCALATLGGLAAAPARRASAPVRVALPAVGAVRAVAVAGLIGFIALAAVRAASWSRSQLDEWGFGSRDRVYRRVADFLDRNGCPGEGLVAAVEVGTLGYYSGCRMFDLGGLTSRLQEDPWEGVHPDWFVLDPHYLDIVPRERPVEVFWDGDFRAYVFAVSPRARTRLGLPTAAVRRQPTSVRRSDGDSGSPPP